MAKKSKSGKREDRICSKCDIRYGDHSKQLCPVCHGPPEHHEPGDDLIEWRGLARMAHARRAAGLPLNDIHHQAIGKYPECPPLITGTQYDNTKPL